MNAIALKHHPIMDGQRLKPGYTLDPLKPLCYWHYDEREEDEDNQIIFDLWETAREIVNLNEFDLAGDFEKHTYQINIGSFSWYVNALKAYRIKLCKAYKLCSSPFNSFKDWCEKALGCTVSAINTRIRAAWAVSFLIAQGFDRLPKSPSIAHELSKLDSKTYYVEGEGQFCQLFDIWCEICHKYADHEITLEKIKEMIGDPLQAKPEMKQIRIPASKYELLFKQAAAAGTTPNALLNLILENYLGDKTDDGLRTTGEDSIPCEKEWLCSDPEESNPRDSSGDLPYAVSGPILSNDTDEKGAGISDGNPPTDTQEPQSKEPDSVTDFKAIAQIELIANAVKREIKTSFHKPEKRNFLKDAPWGKLAIEIGEDPKIVFDDFKQYLIDVATAKPHPNPEAWASSVANSLFNNEGSEANCIPWGKFSESYKTGQTVELPQQTQIDPMEEWFELVKELRMFPQICRKRNAVKDCSDWVPYDQISKRYTLEYLRKQVKKS